MQILGHVQIQGKQKDILLKEEDEFFKYYSLELIGAYLPKIGQEKIAFKKDSELDTETKMSIKQIINHARITSMLQIIGQTNIEGKMRDIVAKKEGEMIKYYYLNLIGVYTAKIPGATIIFRQDTLENAVSAETKDNQQKNYISPTEKEQLEKFLQDIKIKNIIEKMQEKSHPERTKYDRTIQTSKNQEKQIKDIEEQQKQVLQQTIQKQMSKTTNKLNDINIKQEVDMNTRVTDMKNLNQVLSREGKMPKMEHGDAPLKMGIVESDDLKNLKNEKGEKEQGHSSRYEAVVITKKGKVKAMNLENDTQEGTNPREKNYQVKQDGHVKNDDVLTRLKVGQGTIGINKGHYGEVEVYHSPRKTLGGKGVEGNKSLDRQLETSNAKNTLKGTDIETLQLAEEYGDGYRSVEEGYQEVERHKEKHPDCEPKSAKDLDGEKNTKSHTHKADNLYENQKTPQEGDER